MRDRASFSRKKDAHNSEYMYVPFSGLVTKIESQIVTK